MAAPTHVQAVDSIAVILRAADTGGDQLAGAIEALRSRGIRVSVDAATDDVSAVALAEKAAVRAREEHLGAIVAAGGDGTLNEVVNGAFRPDLEYDYGVGVIPLGTANDFARQCSIPPNDPEAALAIIKAGETQRVDLGRMNGRVYVNVALGGFLAEVSSETSSVLKNIIGPTAYLLHGVARLSELSPRGMKVVAPDLAWEGSAYLVVVGNGAVSGNLAQIARRTRINDGLLEVAIVPDVPLTQLAAIAEWVMRGGELIGAEGVKSFQAPWLDIESEGLQINLDGQPFEGDSFHFDVVREGLPFFMPMEPKPDLLK